MVVALSFDTAFISLPKCKGWTARCLTLVQLTNNRGQCHTQPHSFGIMSYFIWSLHSNRHLNGKLCCASRYFQFLVERETWNIDPCPHFPHQFLLSSKMYWWGSFINLTLPSLPTPYHHSLESSTFSLEKTHVLVSPAAKQSPLLPLEPWRSYTLRWLLAHHPITSTTTS